MPSFSYNLSATLVEFGIQAPELDTVCETRKLVNDTRVLRPNDIFCAVIGHHLDGREYIDNAISLGAEVVITHCQLKSMHGLVSYKTVNDKKALIVQFYQLDKMLFSLSSTYYQAPQQSMNMIGITGTNGKTSTSQIIAQLVEEMEVLKGACAVIGTNGAGILPELSPLNNTTPGATELTGLLADFKALGASTVAMEVSSHALAQHRVNGELFDVAVFTNLSREHLDYHQTMAAYEQAKLAIFTGKPQQVAVVNGADEVIKRWLLNTENQQEIIVYGRTESVTSFPQFLYAKDITCHQAGTRFTLITHDKTHQVNSPLIGEFNIDNLLAAIASLVALKINLEEVLAVVSRISAIDGRMELFSKPNVGSTVVDYAHTPDALENALIACRAHCQGTLSVVFGCGGDRDKGKRSEMGEIAERLADHVMITNDNPRSEAPEMIVADILKGLVEPEKATIVLDRKQAVITEIKNAKAGDIVLLAGKGHEDYIIIGDEKIDYNERGLVMDYYRQLNQSEAVL